MLRFVLFACLLLACLAMLGCGGDLSSQPPPQNWTTGFWFWNGSAVRSASAPQSIDVLYVQAGTLYRATGPNGPASKFVQKLSDELPPAREYWLVIRFDRQSIPDREAVPLLAQTVEEL